MRLSDVNPEQAIEVIAHAQKLRLSEANGMHYIGAPRELGDIGSASPTPANQPSGDISDFFSKAISQAYDSMLDYGAKPETAAKLAMHKHNYYLALVKEGFTADEALKIVIASGSFPLPGEDSKTK